MKASSTRRDIRSLAQPVEVEMMELVKPVGFVILVIAAGITIGALAGGGLPSFGGDAVEVAAK